jgi:hypothetical protein
LRQQLSFNIIILGLDFVWLNTEIFCNGVHGEAYRLT